MAQNPYGSGGRTIIYESGAGGSIGIPFDGTFLLEENHPSLPNGREAENSQSIEWDFLTPVKVKAHKKATSFALTPGSTVSSDWSDIADGGTLTLTAEQNFLLVNPSNLVNSKKVTYRIKQDGNGGWVMTLDTLFRLGTDIASIVLSTGPNKVDYLVGYYDAFEDRIDVVAFIKGY